MTRRAIASGDLPEALLALDGTTYARRLHQDMDLRAAAHAATCDAAVRELEAAVAATRRQVRALRRHWIPTLGAALEQADHEDAVRRTAGKPSA